MNTLIETIVDAIAARMVNHYVDVMSTDWQHVGSGRYIAVIRTSSTGQETHTRVEYQGGGPGKVTFSTYAVGVKPDTISWDIALCTRADILALHRALSPST